MRRRLTGALVLLGAGTAGAQGTAGHPPTNSPFRDVEYRQEVSLIGGYFRASTDAAGVAPRSGPLLGVRYEIRVGGPVEFTARAMRVQSERLLIDPTLGPDDRNIGTRSQGLYLADVGFTFNLTGQKTFHGFVPVLHGGAGIAADFQGTRDARTDSTAGGFRFGTPFALTVGGGVRWSPGGPFQVRADVGDHLYQIRYPGSFYQGVDDADPVLASTEDRSQWKHNLSLTVGASYLFFR